MQLLGRAEGKERGQKGAVVMGLGDLGAEAQDTRGTGRSGHLRQEMGSGLCNDTVH